MEDSGDEFSGLTALTARAKVRSVLNEHRIRHVTQCHATIAARVADEGGDVELVEAPRRKLFDQYGTPKG